MDTDDRCIICGSDAPKYDGTRWCIDCVADTLDEQARERYAPVLPQVFST